VRKKRLGEERKAHVGGEQEEAREEDEMLVGEEVDKEAFTHARGVVDGQRGGRGTLASHARQSIGELHH